MEPLSRSKLHSLFDEAQVRQRNEVIHRIVNHIYGRVLALATQDKTKTDFVFKDTDNNYVSGHKCSLIAVSDEVLTQLRTLFPDCVVKFVKEDPVNDIFRKSGRPSNEPPRSAIIIDWS